MTRNLLPTNISHLIAVCIIALAASFSLVGCKKDKPATPAATTQAKPAAQPPKPVQKPMSSIVANQPPQSDDFDFSNKKNPFKPYIDETKAASNAKAAEVSPKKQIETLPILSVDIEQFKIIGVVIDDKNPKNNRAMVKDPSGKGYVIKPGMKIGNPEWQVKSITKLGFEVSGEFTNDKGKKVTEKKSINLPPRKP